VFLPAVTRIEIEHYVEVVSDEPMSAAPQLSFDPLLRFLNLHVEQHGDSIRKFLVQHDPWEKQVVTDERKVLPALVHRLVSLSKGFEVVSQKDSESSIVFAYDVETNFLADLVSD